MEAWDPALEDGGQQSEQLPMGISPPTALALSLQTSLSLKHSPRAPPTHTPQQGAPFDSAFPLLGMIP